MTITTKDELKNAIATWLVRPSDTLLDPYLDDWITLAETRFNRKYIIRAMETVVTASASSTETPGRVALPTDHARTRSIRLTSTTPPTPLEPVELNLFQRMMADDTATGQPAFFTIIGEEWNFWKIPDVDYTFEATYWAKLVALTSNSVNWLLTNAPDVYLFGCLVEAASHLEDTEQLTKWELRYQGAVTALIESDMLGSSPSIKEPPRLAMRGAYGGGTYGAPPAVVPTGIVK